MKISILAIFCFDIRNRHVLYHGQGYFCLNCHQSTIDKCTLDIGAEMISHLQWHVSIAFQTTCYMKDGYPSLMGLSKTFEALQTIQFQWPYYLPRGTIICSSCDANLVVTQPIIKIEIQSRKAEIGLIGIGKIEEDEETTRI